MKNILKWAGSKRWLVADHAHLLPTDVTSYREPFLGGGSVAAHYLSAGTKCHLSDRNAHLIAMCRGVRDDPDDVIRLLQGLKYDRTIYDFIRAKFNTKADVMDTERAAWMIYLNRCGFNGLYRENGKGHFNVPFGRFTNPTICDEETIRAWSKALQKAVLSASDWSSALSLATAGEFVFLDPPYVPVSDTANFTQYQAGGFGPPDQERLVAGLHSLDRRGVRWMLTNAAEARGMYGKWNVLEVAVGRSINSKGGKRGKVGEIIVSNFEMAGRMAA